MKRFVGGADGQVAVLDENGIRWLGTYEWGDDKSPSCATLAKMILGNVIDDDAYVTRIYRRFMHRTVAGFAKGKAWSRTDDEILAVIHDIERVEKETSRDVHRMMREPMRGGFNVGSVRDGSVWDNEPEFIRNDPRKAK